MRLVGWFLILLGVVLLWPLGGVLGFVLGLVLLILGLVLTPILLILAAVLLPLVLALTLGIALLKLLWPAALIAVGVWLVLQGRSEENDAR